MPKREPGEGHTRAQLQRLKWGMTFAPLLLLAPYEVYNLLVVKIQWHEALLDTLVVMVGSFALMQISFSIIFRLHGRGLESQKRFRDVAFSLADWIWEVDAQGVYTYCSEKVEDVLGYSPEEIVGQTPFDLMPPEEVEWVKGVFEEIAARKEPIKDLENWNLHKDGSRILLLTSGVPILDDEGNLKGYRGVDKDITERKRMEEALRERAEIIDSMPDGVLLFDLEGRVVLANQAYCRSMGLEPKEVEGKLFTEIPGIEKQKAEELEKYMPLFQEAVDKGSSGPIELTILTRDGEEIPVDVNGAVIKDSKGNPIRLIVVTRDVTERKRAEERQAYCLEMERVLGQVSSRFVDPQNLDQAINEMLRDTGTVLNANRAYLFKIYDDGAKMDNTHEWVAEGTTPQIENQQGLDTDIFPWWMDTLYNNEVIAASDVSQLPSPEKEILEEQDILSTLVIPISTHGTLYGFFGFDETEQRREWQSEEIGFLRNTTRILGRALERTQAEESLRTRARQLATLNAIGHRAAAILDQQELLQTTVDDVARELGYFRVAVLLMADDTPDELYVAAANDDFWTVISDNYRQRVGEGLIGAAAATGETQLANQALSDPRFYRAGEWGSPSSLSVPIKVGGQVIGVLEVEGQIPNAFDQQDVDVLETVAGQLSVAIANARLYGEAQRQAAQAALTYEVGRRVSGELELDALLSAIVTAVCDAFDYYGVMLMLLDEEAECLTLQSIAGSYADVFSEGLRLAIGEGMTGYAAASGETQVSGDVSKDPHYVRKAKERTKSELAVPIKSGQQVIGVLDIQSDELDAFDEIDVAAMETLSTQVATAFENARLYEEAQQRVTEFSVLYDVATAGTTSLNVDEILQHSLDALRGALRPDDTAILLVKPETGELVIRAWTGFPGGPTLMRRQIGVGIPGWVVQTGEPVLLADVSQDDRYHACDADTGSELCVPLRVGERIIGALNLESRRLAAFSEDDLRLVSTLAGNLAVLIERARLFDEVEAARTELQQRAETLEQRTAQLALLSDIGRKIVAVLELDSMLDSVARLVQESFGYHHVGLFTLDRERGELVMRARAGDFTTLFSPDHRLKLGQGMVGWVGHHGDSLLANDVDADPHYVNLYPDVIPTRSELSVPIRMGREIVGVLDVQSPQLNAFDENDVMVIETLADQIAVATENARLYEAVQQELTERKRAEEQLQRYTAELEQSNKEVKQFAYIVSHDLRAPLVNLKGFAAELRAALAVVGSAMSTTLPYLDEKRRPAVITALKEDVPEALGFIDSSVTRMDHFINAVLKLSRLGRRELRPEPVDMHALVQATLQTLAHQIEARQVSVTVARLPEVVADRTSMEQVLGNLLTNAVIYLDPDRPGEIEVGAGERNQVIKKEPGFTTFWVRDNGRGIAEEDMDKVFAPFRRAGRQDVPGEGMGLPYVQTLVRRHGGRLWVESEPGKGSTFYFTIPVDVKRET